jgi:polysaccharide biosynthesis/export protein
VKKVFLILICCFFQNLFAQELGSDKEIIEMVKKAMDAGMSPEQIETLAASRGYSPSEINRIKSKLLGSKTSFATKTDSLDVDFEEKQVKTKKQELEKESLSPEELKEKEKRMKVFGLSIFNKKTSNFQPNLKIPIPKNYILGTDDALSIDISGYAQAHYDVKVSPQGTIKVENLSPIFVSGLTIDQAKEKVIQRLKSIFGGLSSSGGLTADLTVNKLRSIQVSVIGEAVFPGSYTVPSLATAFNLLFEAGGPTAIGSMRKIQILRGGRQIRTLDLYDYLFKGDLKDDIVLHDQDIINIPYVEAHVQVNGEVRNPKIYEMYSSETLNKLLTYAGGFSENAYLKTIRVDRNTDIGKKIFIVEKKDYASFAVVKGDIVMIDSLSSSILNKVEIKGAVYKPGSFSLESAPTLSKIIAKAEGFKPEAYLKRIAIKRKNPENGISELIEFNNEKLKSGEDLSLQNYDEVQIFTVDSLLEKSTISVDGEVNIPKVIPYVENITLSMALLLSSGLKEGANTGNIEISRRVKKDEFGSDITVETFDAKIDPNLSNSNLDNDLKLKPYDQIFVRKLSQYETQKKVTIGGEVMYPGPYTLNDKKEKISDLIAKAGGLKNQADIAGAKFTRGGLQMGVDLKNILKSNDDIHNLLLINGDALDVPRKKETVKISGNVFSPTEIPFETNLRVNDYIALAGGTNDSGYVKKTYIRYANGRLDRTKHFLGFKLFPKVNPGSEIIVPVKHRQRLSKAEIISISTGMVSLSAVLLTLFRLL